jgi:hypothetical protein
MKLRYFFLVALLLPFAAQAKTGAQLRDDCAAFDEKPIVAEISSNMMRMGGCVAYIDGVLDVPNLYDVKGADYCLPDGITRGTMSNVVRDYLRRPEVSKMTWLNSGAQVVINAVRTRWPCKDTR